MNIKKKEKKLSYLQLSVSEKRVRWAVKRRLFRYFQDGSEAHADVTWLPPNVAGSVLAQLFGPKSRDTKLGATFSSKKAREWSLPGHFLCSRQLSKIIKSIKVKLINHGYNPD